MTPAGASGAERAIRADPPVDDAAPALTVAAVARRLGVAPATLRTWDRRYGLGPSEHVAGSHRRYTASDTARLLVMRRLTLEGVAPAEAARIARSTDVPEDAGAAVRALVPQVTAPPAAGPAHATPQTVRAAAERHDAAECARQLLGALQGRTVAAWWSELVEPVLRSLAPPGAGSVVGGTGDGPPGSAGAAAGVQRAGDGPDAVLAVAVLNALREELARARTARGATGGGPVAGGVEGAAGARRPTGTAGARRPTGAAGSHQEGARILVRPAATALWWATAHALAAASELEGEPAGVLPPGCGATQLIATVEAHRPRAVVILGLPGETDREVVQALHRAEPDLHVFVSAGDGDVVDGLPWGARVHRVRTFTGALHEVLAVCS